jgi:hypothetical protein
MKSYFLFIIFLLILAFSSCEKERNHSVLGPGELTGFWINPQYNDSIVRYERANAFNNGPGIHFLNDDSLVEHKNAGWCGTPPISYADYNGSYSENDSVISVSVGYWGGTSEYKWRLISLTTQELTLKLLSVVYHESQQD